ncbi:helix-turn-helix domain-containing protein [Nocardia sp. NPDC058705]|uniref:helix-turn-helix domain-containing protein n=1 Tax=Nocardia sp. NPDC058705 TaxID=3346609 RepID=UPI0036A65598
MANEPTTLEFSAPSPRSAEFEQWATVTAQAYFPLALEPVREAPTFGRLTSGVLPGAPDFSLVVHAGGNQEYRRDKTHVARAVDEYLLASIQVSGRARLTTGGRSVMLMPGQMTFLDSSLPSLWDGSMAFEQVLVQVPTSILRMQPGLSGVRIPTATLVAPESPAGVVASYFRELARIREKSPAQAGILARSAIDLLGSAVLLAAGVRPVDTPADSLSREHVLVYLRRRCTDPELTVDEVAGACHISRRTLFRLFDGSGDTLNTTLRRMRVRHAQKMLAHNSTHALAAVASASGFASERHFYRVFRQETGMTPRAYRQAQH